MRINNNISALNTYNRLSINAAGNAKAMEKLSSGMRINRAGDDAAGLAISEKMRAQIRGLQQASRNAQDVISLIQTAEGALNETHSILQRMRELAVQSANDTNTQVDRESLQDELNQLIDEIDRIGNSTEFNTMKLLNGDKAGVTAGKAGFAEIECNIANSSVTFALDSGVISNAHLTDVVKINFVKLGDNFSQNTLSVNTALGSNVTVKISSATVSSTTTQRILISGFLTATSAAGTIALTVTNGDKFAVGDTIVMAVGAKEDANADGSKELVSQIGANAAQEMRISIDDMRAVALNLKSTDGDPLSVKTKGEAAASIKLVGMAFEKVSKQRSKLGAYQNRLEHTINNLQTSAENLTASESRIRDVDMASEMITFTKYNILNQAATAMLAQANQLPQSVLQLLQ